VKLFQKFGWDPCFLGTPGRHLGREVTGVALKALTTTTGNPHLVYQLERDDLVKIHENLASESLFYKLL
jgi:hypothetical protein